MKKVSIIIPVYNQETLLIKALDSIPRDNDIEVIVIDDGSNDKTWENVVNYNRRGELDLVLLANGVNKGAGYSRNKGLDAAEGKYIVFLDSDDYFYTDKWAEFSKYLDGTDIVYYNLQENNGDIWRVNSETKEVFCGTTKAIRRSFIKNTRFNDLEVAEDYYFYQDLLAKHPKETFTDITLVHYNFPRKGSLIDIANQKAASGTK